MTRCDASSVDTEQGGQVGTYVGPAASLRLPFSDPLKNTGVPKTSKAAAEQRGERANSMYELKTAGDELK